MRLEPGESEYRFFLSAAEEQLAQQLVRAQREAEEEAEAEAARQAQAAAEAARRAEAQRQAEAQAQAEQQAQAEAQAAARRQEQAQQEAERLAQEQAAAADTADAVAGAPADAPGQATDQTLAEVAAPEQAVSQPTPAPTASGALQVADVRMVHASPEEGGAGAFSFLAADNLDTDLAGFANGTLYQRLEVVSKPSDLPVQYQLCLVPNAAIDVQPACSDGANLLFEGTGVFTAQQPLASMSGYSRIDWANGMESIILVVKDPSGLPLDSRYLVGATNEPIDPALYYPMEVHYSAVIVPPGGAQPNW